VKLRDMTAGILKALYAAGTAGLTEGELAARLDLPRHGRRKLVKALQRLEAAKTVQRGEGGRYAMAERTDVREGVIQFTRAGGGFVRVGEREEIAVPPRHVGTAMPGDRVAVQIDARMGRPGDRKTAGRVIEVLDRGTVEVVGTLRQQGRGFLVFASDSRYPRPFRVHDPRDAAVDDRVVVRVRDWSDSRTDPVAEIIEVIGAADDPSFDTVAALRQYGIPSAFPEEVVREAERASLALETPGEREDLRTLRILTIDPVTARDFDDALSLEMDGEGRRVLGVHIADVSHFVSPGSALDREAYRRGNSVYLPDAVVPMLPEQLSNGVCSLRPDVDRLAFSAFLTLDAEGVCVASRFAPSIIRSCLRLTYEQAFAALQSPTPIAGHPADADRHDLLHALHALAQQMRRRRFASHALDINLPECEVTLGKHGHIDAVQLVENDVSHQLVEECMVAANEAVDKALSDRGRPLIHRYHEPPREERVLDLQAALEGMGFRPGNLTERANLAAFLASVREDPLVHHVHTAVLRSMNRAIYSAGEHGHFGLAKTFYTHFTSPIRRYTDLVVHRALKALLLGRPAPDRIEYLTQAAAHCSRTEETAARAERDVLEVKKYRYLRQEAERKEPTVFDGVVVRELRAGLLVELLELRIEGFVRRSAVVPRERGRGRGRSEPALTSLIGTRLRVFPVQVNVDARQIDFGVAEVGDQPPRPAPPAVAGAARAKGKKGATKDAPGVAPSGKGKPPRRRGRGGSRGGSRGRR
jgi:ribonuclease R